MSANSCVGMIKARSLQLASVTGNGTADAGACSAAAAEQNAFGSLSKMLFSWLQLVSPAASTAAPAMHGHTHSL